jgi:hypothetical protein
MPVCVPPPEHFEKKWHWLRHPRGNDCYPLKWENGQWTNEDTFAINPRDAAREGYKYVGPCEEPTSDATA